MDIVDRLFALVDEKFREQKDFALAIGVPAPRVSEWRKRKSTSYVKRLEKISEVLNTTPQYLLSGDTDKKEVATQTGSGLIEEFGRIFDSLTPENQTAVIAEMLRRQREQ